MRRAVRRPPTPQETPIKRARDLEPSDWQERHSPTEPVVVKLGAGRTANKARRRISDVRLISSLLPLEQEAMTCLGLGFKLATSGIGAKTMKFTRGGRKGYFDRIDDDRTCVEEFWRWAKETQRQKIMVSMALDIIGYGKSCREVDEERKQRKGTAMANLRAALKIFTRQKKWT